VQEKQIEQALEYLMTSYGDVMTFVGLYVNERWEVEELVRIER
jgi:Mg/Co/Ni transporter MgtE